MAILPILSVPDPRLKMPAQKVERVDASIRKLMDDLHETMMYDNQGIGIAANQVGVLKQVIVVDVGRDYQDRPYKMANPEIIEASKEEYAVKEYCLSVPEQGANVFRPRHIRVRFLNEDNKIEEIEASDLLSACLQHEMDHINGKLFIDHLSNLKRKVLYDRAVKLSRFLMKKR